jgi:hypothetical protein
MTHHHAVSTTRNVKVAFVPVCYVEMVRALPFSGHLCTEHGTKNGYGEAWKHQIVR